MLALHELGVKFGDSSFSIPGESITGAPDLPAQAILELVGGLIGSDPGWVRVNDMSVLAFLEYSEKGQLEIFPLIRFILTYKNGDVVLTIVDGNYSIIHNGQLADNGTLSDTYEILMWAGAYTAAMRRTANALCMQYNGSLSEP